MDFRSWLISQLEKRLSKDYKEIKVNREGEVHEFKGFYPDIILASYGITVGLMQVETEETLEDKERIMLWKKLVGLGPRLILMVPDHMKAKVTEILWNEGLVGKVSIATYELIIRL
jgi:hypothetical protein